MTMKQLSRLKISSQFGITGSLTLKHITMTYENLKEGERLQRLIADYERTLDYFEGVEAKNMRERISNFLISAQNVPNKDQMAQVMINAVIDSCNACKSTAQNLFDQL